MSTIPILWYFVYAPIHELSHLLGAYLLGSQIVDVKLIPRFWAGETGGAWITSEGFTNEWSQLIMTISPYFFDLLSIAVGVYVLQRKLSSAIPTNFTEQREGKITVGMSIPPRFSWRD